MIANQLMARIKLQNKKTCALHHSIGESWFQALEAEFKKTYFIKASCSFSLMTIGYYSINKLYVLPAAK